MKPLNELSDAGLNEAFAVEVAGRFKPHWFCPKCNERVESAHVTSEERHDIDLCNQFVHWVARPDYTTSADAVLPWLEKQRVNIIKLRHGWFVSIRTGDGTSNPDAFDASFARAACTALILAKRTETKTSA